MSTNVTLLGGGWEGGELEVGGGKGDQAYNLYKGQVFPIVIFVSDPSEILRNIRDYFAFSARIVERKMLFWPVQGEKEKKTIHSKW